LKNSFESRVENTTIFIAKNVEDAVQKCFHRMKKGLISGLDTPLQELCISSRSIIHFR
jgi:hypothetical protein